jgi:hypothetical protein
MKRIIAIVGAIGILSFAAQAQVLLGSGTYSQDFDSLASTGASGTWADNTTLVGWYASKAYTTSGGTYGPYAYASYRLDTGGNNSGNLFNYGVAGANAVTDRALGSIASGTIAGSTPPAGFGSTAFGLRIQNNTGAIWTGDIGVSYRGEQWRQGGNTSSQIIEYFSYAKSSTPFTGLLSPNITDAAYTAVAGLNFTSPNPGTATAAALDGNASGNYVAISGTLSGITLNAGDEIMLRWYDINDSGNDHGGGIDNLSVTFTPVPEPSSLVLAGLGMLTLALWRRRN